MARTVPTEPQVVVCPCCFGEPFIDGLVVGDRVVEERCGRCLGRGTVPADDADVILWEPVT